MWQTSSIFLYIQLLEFVLSGNPIMWKIFSHTLMPWIVWDIAQSTAWTHRSNFITKCQCGPWGWHPSAERNVHWTRFLLMNMELCFTGGGESFLHLPILKHRFDGIQLLLTSDPLCSIQYSPHAALLHKNSQVAQLELINWRRMPITSYRHFCCWRLSVFHYLCISTSSLAAEKPSEQHSLKW